MSSLFLLIEWECHIFQMYRYPIIRKYEVTFYKNTGFKNGCPHFHQSQREEPQENYSQTLGHVQQHWTLILDFLIVRLLPCSVPLKPRREGNYSQVAIFPRGKGGLTLAREVKWDWKQVFQGPLHCEAKKSESRAKMLPDGGQLAEVTETHKEPQIRNSNCLQSHEPAPSVREVFWSTDSHHLSVVKPLRITLSHPRK